MLMMQMTTDESDDNVSEPTQKKKILILKSDVRLLAYMSHISIRPQLK